MQLTYIFGKMPIKIQSYKHSLTVQERKREEDPGITINLNYNNQEEDVIYEIIGEPRHGSIYESSKPNSVKLTKGVNITSKKSTIEIVYKSNPGWFSIPDSFANGTLIPNIGKDNFQIRMVKETSGKVRSKRTDIEYEVDVVNRNDAPILIVPTSEQVFVSATSTLTNECDRCWKQDDNITTKCKCRALLGNITFADDDHDVDRVRVDISSLHGMLSIDPSHHNLADFNSCAGRGFSTWNCSGTGSHDKKMTFLAQPSDVATILSRVTYQCFKPGLDAIRISVYDGSGDECPVNADRRSKVDERGRVMSSIHSSCYSLTGIIPISVLPPNFKVQLFHLQMMPIQAWVGIFGIFVYGILAFHTFYKQTKNHTSNNKSCCKVRIKGRFYCITNCFGSKTKRTGSKDTKLESERKASDHSILDNYSVSSYHAEVDPGSVSNSHGRWVAFHDHATDQTYYQDRLTRRVTWTKPREDFELVEVDNNSSIHSCSDDIGANSHQMIETIEQRAKEMVNTGFDAPKSSKTEFRWISFEDPHTGNNYYMDKFTRRVTWTKPNEECEIGD